MKNWREGQRLCNARCYAEIQIDKIWEIGYYKGRRLVLIRYGG
jgi:hypothetical protein